MSDQDWRDSPEAAESCEAFGAACRYFGAPKVFENGSKLSKLRALQTLREVGCHSKPNAQAFC